jgi:hypothetical protein
MAQMPVVCDTCGVPVDAQFNPATGSRDSITLNSTLLVTEQCFVRDTIEFLDGGQIVFAPTREGRYFSNYNVICRKLYIVGGKAPGDFNPCGPDDPGRTYDGNNVITWLGRLQTSADGAGFSGPAADGTSHDPNTWVDQGQGNNGNAGGRGTDGAKGNAGGNGIHALGIQNVKEIRPVLNVVALEVEFSSPLSHLTIDWNGQTAGDGGNGQSGGRGGAGMGGRDGSTDDSVWGDSCERQPGNGGNSGDGGNGGAGGNGGRGGDAGDIYIISTAANVAPGGVFKAGQFHFINGGGSGGNPGSGARGGGPGNQVGRKGKKTSECDEADNGQPGNPGIPEPLSSGGTVPGSPGDKGKPGNLVFEVVEPPDSHTCADKIPTPLKITGVAPGSGARNTTVSIVITGIGFNPAAVAHQVELSGVGITVGALTVTATTISCTLTIANLAPQTARDVTVKVGLTDSTTLAGGFTVV